jgi:hypothetical protein
VARKAGCAAEFGTMGPCARAEGMVQQASITSVVETAAFKIFESNVSSFWR